MLNPALAKTLNQLPRETVTWLVAHTVEEIECKLILLTLAHYAGSRTHAARALGLSVRTIRNKIHDYEVAGIAVPSPGDCYVARPWVTRTGAAVSARAA
jgi:DNA-binding NtrC family response regulator